MPRRIVFTSWGSFGDLFPYLGLARELKSRGHAPVIATCPYYADLVRGEGIEFAPLRPDVDPANRELLERVMSPRHGTDVVLRELIVPALQDAYDDISAALRGADLLVNHPLAFAGPMIADQRRLTWISTVLAPISFFSADDFPALPPFPPAVHFMRLGRWANRPFMRLARAITGPWMAPVRAFRSKLGLADAGDPLYEGQFSPHGTLALFSPVIGSPQADWPVNAHATGFVFDNRAISMPDDVVRFLDAGDPPIVFTLGSSAVGAPGAFYEESVAAAHALGRRAILLIGNEENRPIDPLPHGIIAVPSAPHDQLFPRAAAIVHQGGIGTTGQALRSGRPTLIVPHAHDQPDNAFRVTNLGVARTLYPTKYKSPRVVAELGRLLDEPSYSSNAARIATVVRAEKGVSAAADFLQTHGVKNE